jgi:uncharacterized membrane protein YeaQ/YmgE (transglycosylase-associated protein family)
MLLTILAWIVFGLVVGFVARALVPGNQPLSMPATMLLGIGGSFVGGLIGNVLGGYPMFQLHAAGFIGSVIGSILVLLLMTFAGRRGPRFA